jgi:hypothetical protein
MFLDIITCSLAQNPAIVGEDDPVVFQIPFAEATAPGQSLIILEHPSKWHFCSGRGPAEVGTAEAV